MVDSEPDNQHDRSGPSTWQKISKSASWVWQYITPVEWAASLFSKTIKILVRTTNATSQIIHEGQIEFRKTRILNKIQNEELTAKTEAGMATARIRGIALAAYQDQKQISKIFEDAPVLKELTTNALLNVTHKSIEKEVRLINELATAKPYKAKHEKLLTSGENKG